MEEEFEKWAEEKAAKWVDTIIKVQRMKKVFLSIAGLEYVILKAFKAGYSYGKNDVEK